MAWARRVGEYFSIYLKLPALFLVTLLVSTLYYTWFGYRASVDVLMDGVDKRLRMCAQGLEGMLPAGYHDRAVAPDSVPPAEYAALAARLAALAGEGDVNIVYCLARVDGRWRTTASSRVPYFAPYDEPWPTLERARREGGTHFDTGTDEFGPSRSVVRCATSAGGQVYAVGADMSLAVIDRLRRAQAKGFAAAGVSSFFLVALMSLLVVRLITRPLKRLSDHTEATVRDGFADRAVDADLLPLSAKAADEVRVLARNFSTMQGALARYLAELSATVAAKERAESEMRIAGDIQQGMLPADPPAAGAFTTWGAMSPAKEAGGDFYDLFMLDGRRLCFAVGDVSGKGVPAAMFMATSLTLWRACALEAGGHADPARFAAGAIGRLDALLAQHNPTMQFVTVLLGVVDVRTGEGALANGGHNPPLVVRPDGSSRFLDLPPATVLGMDLGVPFSAARLRLAPGESLLLYTDGVTEAVSAAGGFFGEERLAAAVAARREDSARGLVGTVFDAVSAFSAGCAMADDVTVACVRRGGGDPP